VLRRGGTHGGSHLHARGHRALRLHVPRRTVRFAHTGARTCMHADTVPCASTYHGGQSVLLPLGTARNEYSDADTRVKLSSSRLPPRTSSALAFNNTPSKKNACREMKCQAFGRWGALTGLRAVTLVAGLHACGAGGPASLEWGVFFRPPVQTLHSPLGVRGGETHSVVVSTSAVLTHRRRDGGLTCRYCGSVGSLPGRISSSTTCVMLPRGGFSSAPPAPRHHAV
jgi:hypothetical protein